MIDPALIIEWTRLAEEATPAPWSPMVGDDIVPWVRRAGFEPIEFAPSSEDDDEFYHVHNANDAAFIASARDAVPALLKEREELLVELEAYREMMRPKYVDGTFTSSIVEVTGPPVASNKIEIGGDDD